MIRSYKTKLQVCIMHYIPFDTPFLALIDLKKFACAVLLSLSMQERACCSDSVAWQLPKDTELAKSTTVSTREASMVEELSCNL